LSDPSRPVNVSFAGYVSLSAPSPCDRLSRLRVLWADLTPWQPSALLVAVGVAYLVHLPHAASTTFRVRPTSVSGFPRSWLNIRIPCASFPRTFRCPRNYQGLPSSWRFSPRIPRSLWTPADPPGPHPLQSLRVGFWHVKTIAVCFKLLHEAVSSFGKCGLPCGLRGSLCTLQLLRPASPFYHLLTVATLGTGGWLSLTRWGLSPPLNLTCRDGAV